MKRLAPHPQGLDGFIADIDARVREDDKAIAKASAELVLRTCAGGRERVAALMADPAKAFLLTDADRRKLHEFMVTHAPEDTIVDLEAQAIRKAILRIEARFRAFFPNGARPLLGFVPGIAAVAAVVFGYFEPVAQGIAPHCRFVAAATGGGVAEFEFVRHVYAIRWPSPVLLLAAIPFVVAAGLRPMALSVLALNGSLLLGIFLYASVETSAGNRAEAAIAPYCAATDARTGAAIPRTAEQAARIRSISRR